MEGEGGLRGGISEDGMTSNSSKLIPVNIWAWKAIGVIEMVKLLALNVENC
jgi:hypothetical protein